MSLNNASFVQVRQLAISADTGFAEIYLSPDMNTGSSGLSRVTSYSVPMELVPTVSLDSFLRQVGNPHVKLMKIDIEGFEYEAILDSPQVFLEKRISNIALELHPAQLESRGKNASEITDFLISCGYFVDKQFGTLVFSLP